ncbi:hypothetical protein PINS_up022433, partial [Pythium insidiosum]
HRRPVRDVVRRGARAQGYARQVHSPAVCARIRAARGRRVESRARGRRQRCGKRHVGAHGAGQRAAVSPAQGAWSPHTASAVATRERRSL